MLLVGAGAMILLGYALWICRFGFDFTDEGYYLNWISRPYNYPVSPTSFGFVYHPWFLLVGGSVSGLRQLNALTSFCLAFGLAWVVLFRSSSDGELLPRRYHVVVSAGLATTALLSEVFAGMWLPTPSYNTLTYQGLMVAAIGVVFLSAHAGRALEVGAGVLLGVGGWLAFMGKPTSAAAFGGLTCVTLVLMRGRACLLPLSIAAGVGLAGLLLSALLIDGSISKFVDRLIAGVRATELLTGGHANRIFRLEGLNLPPNALILFSGTALVVSVAMRSALVAGSGYWRCICLASALAIVGLGLGMLFQQCPPGEVFWLRRGLLMFAFPVGVMLTLVTSRDLFARRGSFGMREVGLLVFFVAMPYVYAFGTGNEYWVPIASASGFAVIGVHVALGLFHERSNGRMMIAVGVLAVECIVGALFYSAIMNPYRQPYPLTRNEHIRQVGPEGGELILSESHAKYIASVTKTLAAAGFGRGMPMIDLTGHSPNLLFAVGANPIGLAWIIGGYPGSNQFAVDSLRRVPCEILAQAWIVTELEGPLPIATDVLEASYAAVLGRDYEFVGSSTSPENNRQDFFRPVRSKDAAVHNCQNAR